MTKKQAWYFYCELNACTQEIEYDLHPLSGEGEVDLQH